MSFDDIMSGIRRMRANIRISTGRPEAMPREKIRLLGQNLTAKLQSNQASGNPGNPTPNQGTQGQYTPRTTGPFGFASFLRPKPPQPNPPTQEELAELRKRQTLKEIENKALAEKQKKRRLGLMRGLNVNRS